MEVAEGEESGGRGRRRERGARAWRKGTSGRKTGVGGTKRKERE